MLIMFKRILLALAALTPLLFSGCVTNGRHILLREYGSSIPVTSSNSLQGLTICLKGFDAPTNLVMLQLTDKPQLIDGFKYTGFTRDQEKRWDNEQRELAARKGPVREIGNMRDVFGIVMSHVYALNDPTAWLLEGLKYDLEAHGAKVVDAAPDSNADATLGGTLQLCRADMYMTIDTSLVVELTLQPKNGTARQKRIHTHGMTLAVLASEGEYLHAFRDARQQFSILAIRELKETLKPDVK